MALWHAYARHSTHQGDPLGAPYLSVFVMPCTRPDPVLPQGAVQIGARTYPTRPEAIRATHAYLEGEAVRSEADALRPILR